MTNKEIEERLKKMREILDNAFPGVNYLVIDGKEVSWKDFKEEFARLIKMHVETMKKEDGWYYWTPVKEVFVENGKVTVGVCRGFDGPNLMLIYKMVKKSWDNERANYSGKTIQSDEWGIYERVFEGAAPEEIDEGKYQLREVYDTGSCHDLEEIYAELRGGNEAD